MFRRWHISIFCLVLSEDFQWQDTDHIFLSLSRIPETSLIQCIPKDTDLGVSYANAPELIVSEYTQRTSVNSDIDLLPAAGLIDNRKSKTGLLCSGAA